MLRLLIRTGVMRKKPRQPRGYIEIYVGHANGTWGKKIGFSSGRSHRLAGEELLSYFRLKYHNDDDILFTGILSVTPFSPLASS